MPADDSPGMTLLRGVLVLALALAYLQVGDLEASYDATLSAVPMNQQAGNRYAAISCIVNLIEVDIKRGALGCVTANAEKGLAWIRNWPGEEATKSRPGRLLAHLRRVLGEVQYERNELEQAAANLKKASVYYELAQSWGRINTYAALVDVHLARADVEKALSYYRKLKRLSLTLETNVADIPRQAILAQRSLRLSWAGPDLAHLRADAVSWAATSPLQPTDVFPYDREYEYRVLAEIFIAQHKAAEVMPLLDRLTASAEAGRRHGELIDYLSLQALAYYSEGRREQALAYLSRALKLAQPEGYVRTFAGSGPVMCNLLELAARQGIDPAYIDRLLAAFPSTPSPAEPVLPSQDRPLSISPIDPLNDRELQILRLVSARLSNQEIAAELYLSVNTVKWYARSIYDKLGVANRREAGSRARELGLL
jgi:LuxR family maltose regulon positive regulatory protein